MKKQLQKSVKRILKRLWCHYIVLCRLSLMFYTLYVLCCYCTIFVRCVHFISDLSVSGFLYSFSRFILFACSVIVIHAFSISLSLYLSCSLNFLHLSFFILWLWNVHISNLSHSGRFVKLLFCLLSFLLLLWDYSFSILYLCFPFKWLLIGYYVVRFSFFYRLPLILKRILFCHIFCTSAKYKRECEREGGMGNVCNLAVLFLIFSINDNKL